MLQYVCRPPPFDGGWISAALKVLAHLEGFFYKFKTSRSNRLDK